MSPTLGKHARKAALGVGAVAALGAIAALARRPVEVPIHRVEVGEVVLDATGTGTVESEAVVALAFTIPGRLTSLTVNEGDAVQAGQELGKLDVGTTAREREVAAASVSLAATGVARAEAEIARAEAVQHAAAVDRDRARALAATGALHQAELDAAEERLARAVAELAAARAARTQGQDSVGVAHRTVALHDRRLDDGVLRSPLDGVVLKRHHEPGDVLGTGGVVLTVASTRKLWARVWIDESALGSLRRGASARVTLRGGSGPELGARVDRIAPEADRLTHEVLVDLELLDRPAGLVLGQRVDAKVLLDARRNVLRVPRAACDPAEGRCLVSRGGKLALSPVQAGLLGTESAEILAGLAPGDEIVDRRAFDGPPPIGRAVRARPQ